jgi:hypothetical protein
VWDHHYNNQSIKGRQGKQQRNHNKWILCKRCRCS